MQPHNGGVEGGGAAQRIPVPFIWQAKAAEGAQQLASERFPTRCGARPQAHEAAGGDAAGGGRDTLDMN